MRKGERSGTKERPTVRDAGEWQSRLRAVAADLVDGQRHAACTQRQWVGGALIGWLYEVSLGMLVTVVIVVQATALGLFG